MWFHATPIPESWLQVPPVPIGQDLSTTLMNGVSNGEKSSLSLVIKPWSKPKKIIIEKGQQHFRTESAHLSFVSNKSRDSVAVCQGYPWVKNQISMLYLRLEAQTINARSACAQV